MKKTDLHKLLQENDYAKFQEFIKSVEIGSVTEDEEREFFRAAPKEWLQDYISRVYPQPSSERVLMVRGTPETLKISEEMWGFWEENILWAFKMSAMPVCKKILDSLSIRPGDEIELAMIKRKSSNLLKLWLEKFHNLGESSEKLIHESSEYFPLKQLYINEQLKT